MIKWASFLIIVVGLGHLAIAVALTAPAHAEAWFAGGFWREDLAQMSHAHAAYWATISSFGVPLAVLGFTLLWLNDRGVVPPAFIAWMLAAWTVFDAFCFGPSPGLLLLPAAGLLLAGAWRADRKPAPSTGGALQDPS